MYNIRSADHLQVSCSEKRMPHDARTQAFVYTTGLHRVLYKNNAALSTGRLC